MSGQAPAADERPEAMLGRERVALVLLAVAGACILPGALDRFVFPKLAVAAVAVALAVTVAPRGRLPAAARVILALGSLLLVVGALTGDSPVAQLIGRSPRYEGLVALAVYLGAGACGARLLGPGRPRGSTAWFLDWLALSAIVIAIEAILETAGLRPLVSNVSRPGSLLGNASDEGAWALLALGPLASVGLRAREPLHVAGAVAAATTLVCSGSRGALAGGLALTVVLAVLVPRPRLRLVLAGGVAVVVAAAFVVPATRSRVIGQGGNASKSATGHVILWDETARLIADAPGLGPGPSGYVDAIPAYHDHHYEAKVGPANPPDSPHDWILQAGVAGGVPLLVLALALAGLTLSRGLSTLERQPSGGESAAFAGMLAGLVGYGVALLFYFTTAGSTPLAAVMGGALLAVPGSPPGRRAAQIVAGAAFGALALVLAAAAFAELPLRSGIDAATAARLAAADRDFRLARDLRPWDPAIDAEAAHAFAVLAADGVRGAGATGAPWAQRSLNATPNSVQALSDAAELDLASGQLRAGDQRLATAIRDDPANPALRAQAARLRGG